MYMPLYLLSRSCCDLLRNVESFGNCPELELIGADDHLSYPALSALILCYLFSYDTALNKYTLTSDPRRVKNLITAWEAFHSPRIFVTSCYDPCKIP